MGFSGPFRQGIVEEFVINTMRSVTRVCFVLAVTVLVAGFAASAPAVAEESTQNLINSLFTEDRYPFKKLLSEFLVILSLSGVQVLLSGFRNNWNIL